MFRKLHNVFRPNDRGRKGRDLWSRSEQEYHSACTVRLVRSTSVLLVGEQTPKATSTLKRSKSTVSVESSSHLWQRQGDEMWSHSQNHLEYLEALVDLRRQYTKSMSDFSQNCSKATVTSKKKRAPPPPPPTKKDTKAAAEPSAPPALDEEDTLKFFDAVIASCDSEAQRKPYADSGHADVDFIVASSSAEHDLHSNWLLRVPRVVDSPGQDPRCAKGGAQKHKSGSTSSRLHLQRNPIHLPKAVHSAFQSLRSRPKLKK